MSIKSIELYLSGGQQAELYKTVVYTEQDGVEEVRVSERGKRSEDIQNGSGVSCFNWTPAVQALTILLIKAAEARLNTTDGHIPEVSLVGEVSTPASSLDYAISKQPNWILDMFGWNEDGHSLIRDLIYRINAERKRPGPVKLCLNGKLPPGSLKVFVDGTIQQVPSDLLYLEKRLFSSWKPFNVSTTGALRGKEVSRSDARRDAINQELKTESVRTVPDVALEEYANIWRSKMTQEEAIRNTQLLLGDETANRLLLLDCSVELDVYNTAGDTKVTYFFEVVNLSGRPVDGQMFDLWFEFPRNNNNFELFAQGFDDADHPSIHMIRDYANYKQIFVKYPSPVKPLESYKFNYGYRALGFCCTANYWDFPISYLTNKAKLSIRQRIQSGLKFCYITKELSTGQVVSNVSDFEIEVDREWVAIEWRKEFPRIGETYRTYWELTSE